MYDISFNSDFFKNVIFHVFKFLCSIYVWNLTIYQNIESMFEKQQYQEPSEPLWVDYLTLEYDDSLTFRNTDIYTILHDISQLNRVWDNFHHTKPESNYIMESLFIAKQTEGYLVRMRTTDKEIHSITDKSSVQFVYVEYSHPDMHYVIELDLPDTMYFPKNELFSCSFVLRMLEKQTVHYVFDEKYKLTLLDNFMNSCVLNMHHYITLYQDHYTIETSHNKERVIDLIHTSEEHAIEKIYSEPHTVFLKDFSNLFFKPTYGYSGYDFHSTSESNECSDISSDLSIEKEEDDTDETFQIVDDIK